MSRREFENIISREFGQNVKATTEKGLHIIKVVGITYFTRENQSTIDAKWHGRLIRGTKVYA